MRTRIQTLAVLIMLALAACGEEEKAEEPAADVQSYLPSDSSILSAVDFTAAREQLDLPPDADALPFDTLLADDFDPESSEAALLNAAMIGVPLLSTSAQTLESDPVAEVFDGTRVTAAATASGEDGPVSAIATTQPFEELADALEAEGYERDGDSLTKADAQLGAVADTGEGVVLISSETDGATELAGEPAGGPADLIELLEPADLPVTQAASGLGEDCMTAFGGWEDATTSEGVLRIALDQPAEVERLDQEGIAGVTRIDASIPVAEGQSIEVPFTVEGEAPGSAIRDLLVSFGTNLYDCE